MLFTDSMNAKINVMNPLNAARTRYIDIRYKWIIDRVKKGMINVTHIPGTEMAIDGLTKPLSVEKHAHFVRMLGMEAHKVPWLVNN